MEEPQWYVLLPSGLAKASPHQVSAANIRGRNTEDTTLFIQTPHNIGGVFEGTFMKVITSSFNGEEIKLTKYFTKYTDGRPNIWVRMVYGSLNNINKMMQASRAMEDNLDMWERAGLVGGMRRRRKSKSKSRKMSKRRRGRKIHKTKRANIKRRKSYRNRK
jgi:hypothetical protein